LPGSTLVFAAERRHQQHVKPLTENAQAARPEPGNRGQALEF
jgi:hypothetical protein